MEVSVRELKARLSAYLRRVQHGEEVVVTNRGMPIGRIVPVASEREVTEADTVRALRRLPWIRAGSVGRPIGAADPLRVLPGEKTLSDIVLEERG